MRLPKMTTRRWMIAVAVLGILFAAGRTGWTCFVRWRIAELHGEWSVSGPLSCAFGLSARDEAELARLREYSRKYRAHHAALERTYRHAAFRPWLPDPPKSPPPE